MASETVVSARTSATSGTTTVVTVTRVDDMPLRRLSRLLVRMNVTQAMAGTTPTMDIYLQRALAPSPGASDWEDFYHFPQVTTSLTDRVLTLPLPEAQDADASLATYSRARAIETLAADTCLGGYWGDQIRIREVIGGTVSTAAIYSIYMVGQ